MSARRVEQHVITYPGFAESSSAKGLYPDFQAAFPDYTFHMLPFYEELPDGDRVVHSIKHHSRTIQEYMDGLDGEITMFAKCGGTRPAVGIDDEHISRLNKLVLINPPWKVSKNFLLYQLSSWNANRNPDGSYTLPRGDAGNYVVTNEYVNDVDIADLVGRFNEISHNPETDLYIVRAMKDEMFPPIRADKVDGANFIDIEDGDHHLLNENRKKVIGALALRGVL